MVSSGDLESTLPPFFTRDLQMLIPSHLAGADPLQFGDRTITQSSLYTGLLVIGIPLLFWASPLGTFFWLVGASSIIIFGHASIMEPGIESEYAQVDGGV
jgi:PRA1 family protein 1